MSRIRPVIQGRPAGGASHHVPVSCRLSAAGIRFSVIRFPPRDRLSSRSAHRPNDRTQTGLPRSARTSCDRGGCPLYPEDSGAHPAGSPPRRHPPLPSGSPSTPPRHPTVRGFASRGINRGSITFTRPVFPSPMPPGWNQRRFGFPLSFAPRRHRQRTSGAGTGHRARTWNNALRHQPNLRSCVFTQYVRPRVARRVARQTSSTVARPAFVSARAR